MGISNFGACCYYCLVDAGSVVRPRELLAPDFVTRSGDPTERVVGLNVIPVTCVACYSLGAKPLRLCALVRYPAIARP